MPTGHTLHRTVEVAGDRLLCSNCGWVRAARKGGRPYCAVAKTLYRTRKHVALRGASCEVCGSTEDLQTDHDHSCCARFCCEKCFRGTLCGPCNRAEAHVARALANGTLGGLMAYIRKHATP